MRNVWGGVVLGVAAMVCVTIAVVFRRDTTAIMLVITSVALPMLGLLLGKLDHVKEQTDGNTTRLLTMVEGLSAQLAATIPPTVSPPPVPPLPPPSTLRDAS
jgi:hypothetical protein